MNVEVINLDFSYPISYDWSTDEIVDVIKFYEMIELTYEKGIDRDAILSQYRRFKDIVPSKAEERKLTDEYEELSGFSTFKVIKKAKELSSGDKVKMEKAR